MSDDVLGLGGIVPGPGWHVLDAARTQRFTGELVMRAADVEVRVYLDRGLIYTAERATDPSLGARLVEAGAINEAQLDYGTLRVGDIEHLGRLFDRVPSINRDGVLVVNQLMTDECVRSIAGERVINVDATPYRHHPSGMHRWEVIREVEATLASDVPAMALPAPAPDAQPVSAAPPAPALEPAETVDHADHVDADTVDVDEPRLDPLDQRVKPAAQSDDDDVFDGADDGGDDEPPIDALFDDLVRWDEPSRVDPTTLTPTPTPTPQRRERRAATAVVDPVADDWIDRLGERGLEDAPVGAPVGRLAPVAVRAQEHFEMVWPSGETIDVMPDESEAPAENADGEPDIDRAGPTARIGATPVVEESAPSIEPAASDLAIRRAVATIDTGSLEARRRLVDAASPTAQTADLPGRLAMRSEHIARSTTAPTSPTSVFDEVPLEVPTPDPEPATAPADDRHGRGGALRRLIGHLRGD